MRLMQVLLMWLYRKHMASEYRRWTGRDLYEDEP